MKLCISERTIKSVLRKAEKQICIFFNKTKSNVAALLSCRFTKNGLQVAFEHSCFETLISLENFSFIHLLQNVYTFCELFFVYILVHLPCNFKLFVEFRNLVPQLNADGNWGTADYAQRFPC